MQLEVGRVCLSGCIGSRLQKESGVQTRVQKIRRASMPGRWDADGRKAGRHGLRKSRQAIWRLEFWRSELRSRRPTRLGLDKAPSQRRQSTQGRISGPPSSLSTARHAPIAAIVIAFGIASRWMFAIEGRAVRAIPPSLLSLPLISDAGRPDSRLPTLSRCRVLCSSMAVRL
jgi:hypothetical protein